MFIIICYHIWSAESVIVRLSILLVTYFFLLDLCFFFFMGDLDRDDELDLERSLRNSLGYSSL